MKAIRLEEPKNFQYIDVADPGQPGPGQVLVRTHRMGVCGTDLSGWLGKFPFFRYPRIPGHELGVESRKRGKQKKGKAEKESRKRKQKKGQVYFLRSSRSQGLSAV